MSKFAVLHRPLLAALAVALAAPVIAQSSTVDPAAEARIRKLEAEVRALQRQVFPGGDGKYFPPLAQPGQPSAAASGTPASNPVADLLARVDAIEAQLARLTAQQEENTNKLSQFEARLAAVTPTAAASPAATGTDATPVPSTASSPATSATTGATTAGNLAAMTGGASTTPRPTPAATTAAVTPAPTPRPSATPTPRASTAAASTRAGTAAATPSAQRLAAVRAIEKPKTDDAGDDEYSYGFRLWEAKFYPEAQQQLKIYLDKYPRHARRSYARNLLGRAFLDAGNLDEAKRWFLANYNDQQFRERAPDSVLFLAEATKQQKDVSRACIALARFVDEFPREAAGRLKSQYDATRAGLKCN